MTVTDLPGTAWLRALKSDPAARTVLVCFPPGGGSVTAYRALAQRFGSGAAVFGVQYPGRLDRLADAPVPVLTELAERAAADLLAWPRDVRLAIFGHSMGATVAYETARRVEAGGRAVSHLFVSGRPAPAFEETSRVHEGPDAGLIAELERLSNDPESVRILRDEPGLAELVLPAVRNDYRAVETYRHAPGAPLRTAITALVRSSDPTTSAAQAGEWRDYTAAGFDLATFPGGHFYLDLPENLTAIVDLITRTLAGTVPGRSS
ncbi:thioesterase II family protein [Nocardia seriolae]|uniref:Thioesterase TesA n=1 Tax=Nocardia seriolae TaxID=37332 RepID=A0A0B8N6I4_9NOCA|nr:alpha/beta fold hydrolase [Nocardia seriolae]MTJ63533.1 alpha/beta fold hydrolase [Nocardia seriolae]MTJ75736.1 alpha/beta fold hydrolase [Nocardia seriolae]MTJ88507.1 alpha/beta fold hydrolase [Nocardia seriolae]MTK32490.1 alpha/beta fold hydrolase [Nocardia seriolae]MTK41432.1 alpha/beta fold hydrolase [Nocardia seriolae]